MNEFLEKFLADRSASRPLAEDEYIDKTSGLVYCKKCHTPRQASVELGGTLFHPCCICQCQSEARELELAKEKQLQEQQRIARLKANGLQDASLRQFTFANDTGINPEMQKAHSYVEHWPEMKATATGLLLWGNVGTGKSFFAGCIANALLDQGVPVLMTNFSRILNALTGMFSDDRNKYIDSLNHYSLLIIDDLGMERGTEYALEQVFNVIDARLRSNLPLIVTTNLTLDELKHPADLAHERIYSRVLERCIPLKINNQNIRQMKKVLQAKHRVEAAEARSRVQERKARTRRLIQEGAILESVYPQCAELELETLKSELKRKFASSP